MHRLQFQPESVLLLSCLNLTWPLTHQRIRHPWLNELAHVHGLAAQFYDYFKLTVYVYIREWVCRCYRVDMYQVPISCLWACLVQKNPETCPMKHEWFSWILWENYARNMFSFWLTQLSGHLRNSSWNLTNCLFQFSRQTLFNRIAWA